MKTKNSLLCTNFDSANNRLKTTLFNGIYDMNQQQRLLSCDQIDSVLHSWTVHIIQKSSTGIEKTATESTEEFHSVNGQNRIKFTHSPLSATTSSISDISSASSSQSAASGGLAGDSNTDETHDLLHHHLLLVLRMSINCPFEDVRLRFRSLLAELKSLGLKIPQPVHSSPSFFINKDRIVPLDTQNQVTQKMMISSFLSNGRFSHVYRLMSYFPGYLEKYMQAYNQIMRYQGPIPRSWRNYIAILAASQHNCQYLVSLQTREFLVNGGDPQWLLGLCNSPRKIQNLSILNTLMAHQPWLLTRAHIRSLSKGTDSWSMSELVQAIVIIATFHSLCSFVLGCGVTPEIDMAGGIFDDGGDCLPSSPQEENLCENDPELAQQTNELISRLLRKNSFDTAIDRESSDGIGGPSKEVFENCESTETFKIDGKSIVQIECLQEISPNVILEDLNRFRTDFDVEHVDFNVKSNEYSVFRLQDYNWEEQGCALIGKYLAEVGDYIDEEFSAILTLTDYSLYTTSESQTEIDTWPFRQAIWYYVLRLSGMSHDDYNYHEVNIYLNKRIKQYIKKVACDPETIVAGDFHKMGFNFRPDEKVQINLLAAEARKCAELLYAMKCVSDESH